MARLWIRRHYWNQGKMLLQRTRKNRSTCKAQTSFKCLVFSRSHWCQTTTSLLTIKSKTQNIKYPWAHQKSKIVLAAIMGEGPWRCITTSIWPKRSYYKVNMPTVLNYNVVQDLKLILLGFASWSMRQVSKLRPKQLLLVSDKTTSNSKINNRHLTDNWKTINWVRTCRKIYKIFLSSRSTPTN